MSKLTGKCKESFEEWLIDKLKCKPIDFYDLWFSMQFSVYVDFFDSVDIEINIKSYEINSNYRWFIYINGSACNDIKLDAKDDNEHLHRASRLEARLAAIEKANKLFN